MHRLATLGFLLALCLTAVPVAAGPARAGEADVVAAEALREPAGTWRFDVTLRHADGGWEHYADAWEVLAPDGRLLATSRLLHPHVEEQPFTRSLGGVAIPAGVSQVTIRAHDSVHGYGGRTLELTLPGTAG
ncbi:hypothetical protein SAMN06265365_108100 [Tistlia consotensis]|uniref:Uncharacterized protein n=1 Tax=Tistlia consotensis USBA 355 TaxID=560819 RepID=A0A1Y6BQR3_9PROT|nr:hypothetical protein [Tistlia consotensis]SMF24321.1 hypothetical protein SAMN05428998_10880 [Tistlia consotensis USBA 355]SNR60700.1 hypothetical protein SAMN06265365_108100 [Tistlia consotensis]